jgi:hypothetical protein
VSIVDAEYRRTSFETEAEAEAAKLSGEIVVDRGPHVWPRWDLIVPPAVGATASYGFNGDRYPDGFITHVTKGTLRVVKTSGDGQGGGHTYYRRGNSGTWIMKGGTWALVRGWHSTRNREL